MDIPPGLQDSSVNGKGCKLKKALYGLNNLLGRDLRDFLGLCISVNTSKAKLITYCSSNIFLRFSWTSISLQGKVTALIVYVDDIILTGNDDEEIQNLRKYLAHELKIKKNGKFEIFSWHQGS